MKIILEIKDKMTQGDCKELEKFLKSKDWCKSWEIDWGKDKKKKDCDCVFIDDDCKECPDGNKKM